MAMIDLYSTDWALVGMAMLAGFLLGFGTAIAIRSLRAKTARELAEAVHQENERLHRESQEAMVARMEGVFGRLSLDALQQSTDEFLKLAEARLKEDRALNLGELDAKKNLIDAQLGRVSQEMEKVAELVRSLEKDRHAAFGALDSQLKSSMERTRELVETTQSLREALASNKARGQWGERMAEDVLRMCGLKENVNYLKQKKTGENGSRPDFTFLLPQGRSLNMDVKFPLANYLKSLEATSEMEKRLRQKEFLRDVRARVREVTTREYINAEQDTLGYVLLFIPNEQIYSMIHEQDPGLLEEAMGSRVLLCSPLTLFAVLVIIRQAIDHFTLEQTSTEILQLMRIFRKEWGQFCKKLDLLGKRIGDTQKEYEALITTRRRQLEKPLNRIDALQAGPFEKNDPAEGSWETVDDPEKMQVEP